MVQIHYKDNYGSLVKSYNACYQYESVTLTVPCGTSTVLKYQMKKNDSFNDYLLTFVMEIHASIHYNLFPSLTTSEDFIQTKIANNFIIDNTHPIFFCFIEVLLIYNVVLISAMQ